MADKTKIKIPRVEPLDLTQLPMKLPKVELDHTKCAVPLWCKQCLQQCPQMIFKIYCNKIEKGKETDAREPGTYEILPVRRDKCTMCGKCVEVCPEGAITVSFEDTVLKGTKKFDTIAEAKKSDYPLFVVERPYSYDLNPDMLEMLHQEFGPDKVVSQFAEAIKGKKESEIDKIAERIFSEYGRQWMKRTLQLGEEYQDRTYEAMRSMIDHTGELFFPLVPQRFIEIAYLGAHGLLKVPVLENWLRRLVYQVPDCLTLRLINEKCGQKIADKQPCQYACLSALETLFKELDLEVKTERQGATSEKKYCEYRISKL